MKEGIELNKEIELEIENPTERKVGKREREEREMKKP